MQNKQETVFHVSHKELNVYKHPKSHIQQNNNISININGIERDGKRGEKKRKETPLKKKQTIIFLYSKQH